MAIGTFAYPASFVPASRFAKGESGYVVTFRDLPEAITQGEDLADAMAMAADCLAVAIAGRLADAEPIPPPSRRARGERLIGLPAQLAAKAALYVAMRQARITPSQLARRLRIADAEVARLLHPQRYAKLALIESALASLGKRLEFQLVDAA